MSDLKLSPRQAQCLYFVGLGRTSAQIAEVLGLSVRTVDQYVAESCARLSAQNRTHAVVEALRLGLIGEDVVKSAERIGMH